MRKGVFVLAAAAALLFAGCLSRQVAREIREYSNAAKSARPAEDLLLSKAFVEEVEAIAGKDTLGEYVLFALKNNPAVSAARGMWLAAKARVIIDSSLDDPMLTYQRFVREVDQRRMASIMQQFPTPPKLAVRGRAASEVAAAAEQQYRAAALETAMRVKQSYYELYYVRRATEITRENRDILKRFVDIALAQLKVGKVGQQDVLKAQVELDRMENDLIVLEEQWETVLAEFNSLLYRPLSSEVKLPEALNVSFNIPALAELFNRAVKERPEILSAAAAVRRGEAMLLMAKLMRVPDLTLGVDWGQMLMMEGGTKSAVALTFGFNLPIWLNRLEAQELEARAMLGAAVDMRSSMVSETLAQTKATHYRYENAIRLEKLYSQSIVPRAEQSLKLAETSYKAAMIDFLNLLDSQRTLLEFRLAHLRALVDCGQRLAELERIVGKSLSNDKTSGDDK